MKIRNVCTSERGQAIVLIVLALVALFAFAGLAIDGGMVLAERRSVQNAADAAAFAAAMAGLQGGDPAAVALSQAGMNQYIDSDAQPNPGAPVDVIVNHPPQNGQYAGDTEYYQVLIRVILQSSITRLLMIDSFTVEAQAITHVRPSASLTNGNAIHALNTSGKALEFLGDISVQIEGGNMMSNAEIDKKGGSGDIAVTGGGIFYVQGDASDWLGDVTPAPQRVPAPQLLPAVPTPNCGTTYQSAPISNQGKQVYSPGIYNDKIVINAHDDVTFLPGVYCFMAGLHDNGNASLQGEGVFFVLLGGDVQFNGNSQVNLTRPNNLVDASGNQWGGMLLYVPPSNEDAVIDITGNNESTFSGTIFGPQAYCRIGGTTKDLGLNSNIACLDILFHGTPDVLITYNEPQNYRSAPKIELVE